MRQPIPFERNRLSGIKQQQIIQPPLNLIIIAIPNRISHSNLLKPLKAIQLLAIAFLPDLLNQLQRQRPSRSLIPIDGTTHKQIIRAKE